MKHACWCLLACLAAACGGGARPGALAPAQGPASPLAIHSADSLGHALARQTKDSAADQAVLDTLRTGVPHDSAARKDSLPNVRGEEVVGEAERLFGPEGRQVVGAAPPGPTFDIDVTSFSTNRRVLQYLEFFQVDARDRFEIWLSRLGRYQGMIRERLRAKGLPEDLLYLTLIESGLSNTAVSRARAVGMWQFIAGTARLYGLTVDPWVDERRDPYRATDAAANYLGDLVERLGSVYLAAAAYNAGAGRVERGIGRLPGDPDSVSDLTFFQLSDRRYLRRETRDYVPKLIAASLIAKQPERYGFTDIEPLPPLVFDEILRGDRRAQSPVRAWRDPAGTGGDRPDSAGHRHRRGRALCGPAGDAAHHVRRSLCDGGPDALGHRQAVSRDRHDDPKRQSAPGAAGAAGGAARDHSDERPRRAAVGVERTARAALPPHRAPVVRQRWTGQQHRREPPRGGRRDRHADRAPLRRVAG